jgi:tetratricopeptide (TPR) repeat protein
MKTLLLALVPALALAQSPQPTSQRYGALLIPMDRGAEVSAPRLEGWMQEALAEFPGAKVKKTDELFGMPGDEAAEASLQRAERGFGESQKAFGSSDPEDAERKLRATLKEYGNAAGAMKACGNYCEALVMYAAVLQKRGDTEEARSALLDLLALDPTREIDPKKFGRDVITLRSQVATSRSALFRGSAELKSRPSGARVYLDGDFKGFTPLRIAALPVGKHLLRVERPGFKAYGQLIEVTPDDIEVQAELSPTAAWKSWDGEMDKVAQDAARGSGPALVQAGKSFGLDRAIIGTVKELNDTGATEINAGLFDLRTGKRLSQRRVVYQGDEYGQLQSEVTRLVNHLLNHTAVAAERESSARAKDPLDRTSGTEEWTGEDRGGRATTKKKTKGDPLNAVNGMEDW